MPIADNRSDYFSVEATPDGTGNVEFHRSIDGRVVAIRAFGECIDDGAPVFLTSSEVVKLIAWLAASVAR